MKKKRKILGIAGGLLFMAFVAVNLTVSRNYQGDESVVQLSLKELSAKAQTTDECWNPFTHQVVPCNTRSDFLCPGTQNTWVIRCIWHMDGYSSCTPDMQDLCP
ncbi:hypothetical protein [Membranihabitans maritimus]|uniref:hypothetical protein n=1 Tax=Membranihabitans maritimus TaxID=2904244 RepID=UPI001F3D710D|nr:hypothetical protein [Membranihabitans maritimus]